MKKASLLLLLLVITHMVVTYTTVLAQHQELYKREIFVSRDDTLRFRILYPADFDETRAYPLLLFLHGAGERGHDNKAQLVHGSHLFADSTHRRNFPAIVAFPQCPKNDYWAKVEVTRNEATNNRTFGFLPEEAPTHSMSLVMAWLSNMTQQPYVDENRIYVGGLSMGGMGTFDIVTRMPRMFAAAFPICGGSDPDAAYRYARQVPFWIFHGDADNVVNPEYARVMTKAISDHGGRVKLTMYEGVGHNSWDAAFIEPKLLPWIFSHSNHQ